MKRFEIDVARVLLGSLSRAQVARRVIGRSAALTSFVQLLKGYATLRKIERVLQVGVRWRAAVAR